MEKGLPDLDYYDFAAAKQIVPLNPDRRQKYAIMYYALVWSLGEFRHAFRSRKAGGTLAYSDDAGRCTG